MRRCSTIFNPFLPLLKASRAPAQKLSKNRRRAGPIFVPFFPDVCYNFVSTLEKLSAHTRHFCAGQFNQEGVNSMANLYLTIGRQFGSGGREIGKRVANALGINYYDKELLAVAAKASGLSHQFLESYDEKPTNSFFYSLVMGQQNLLVGSHGITVEQLAAKAQREAVLSVAEQGSCVIVGRCADYLLRDRPGLIRVFVCADWEKRLEQVMERDNLTKKEAEEKMRRMDRARASYYSFHTDRKWGAAESYDLCVNSSRRGLDKTIELILAFLQS